MANRVTVLGYGAIGRALTERLTKAGRSVVVAQRSAPAKLPAHAEFTACDVLDAPSVVNACRDVDTVVLGVGLAYKSATWMRDWPIVMQHAIDAAERAKARLVIVDNLYMYGPQTEPLVETMPLTTFGKKPACRAQITQAWLDAHRQGRVRATAVRGSDFYGPEARAISRLGDTGIKRLIAGKAALTIDPIDTPHDFTFTHDFARALESLIEAPDDAYGQAWHVPNAQPTPTLRSLLQIAAKQLDVELRVSAMPGWLKWLISPFMPIFSEMKEMQFQWDGPYRVNADKFAARFWSDPTSFEAGIAATIEGFRADP